MDTTKIRDDEKEVRLASKIVVGEGNVAPRLLVVKARKQMPIDMVQLANQVTRISTTPNLCE